MSDNNKQIPIWFFIGLLLVIYGVLITGASIYDAMNPPPEAVRVALWNLHSGIWWGVLLTIFGLVYVIKFRPRPGEGLTGKVDPADRP